MNFVQMVHEIRTLSSGTVSRLCGDTNYERIEEYVSAWIQWVISQPVGTEWDTWQDCHEQYLESVLEHQQEN